MNNICRIYKPYIQYIGNIYKLSDETAQRLIIKLAEFCAEMLDNDNLSKQFNKKFEQDGLYAKRDELLKPILEAENKLDAMIQLTFLVNKCTKTRSIKEEEKLSEHSDNWNFIYENINSTDEKEIKKALKAIANLSEEDFVNYTTYDSYENRKEILYEIKHKLLAEIIKELWLAEYNTSERETDENDYGNKKYWFGFIRDKGKYVFAINIRGHMGTYQFHILPEDEKEILFDIDCYKHGHEYEELVVGTDEIGKMSILFSKDCLDDPQKLENTLNELKKQAKKITESPMNNHKNEEILRKIFLFSILLEKNPYVELKESNEIWATELRNKNDENDLKEISLNKKTLENSIRYSTILSNLKDNKKIYISSRDTVDSKVAIESLIREAEKNGIKRNEIRIIEVKPRRGYK